eukprot:1161419-Pelagomonas_calceolata.AAC.4
MERRLPNVLAVHELSGSSTSETALLATEVVIPFDQWLLPVRISGCSRSGMASVLHWVFSIVAHHQPSSHAF